jgi:hypothetical protein
MLTRPNVKDPVQIAFGTLEISLVLSIHCVVKNIGGQPDLVIARMD